VELEYFLGGSVKNYPAVKSVIDTASYANCYPSVVVDWNMNRFIGATADNNPSDDLGGFDIEYFPVESIIEPLRPTKGINKARIGGAKISEDYKSDSTKINARYYVSDIDDVYKYWTSPEPSNASTGTLANCSPYIVYDELVGINKIVITIENSWASPKTFSIQTTTASNNTGWTEIANNTEISGWKPTGRIVLYWNGTDWVSGSRSDNADGTPKTVNVRGIKITVTSLEGGYKYTNDGSEIHTTYYNTDAGSYTQVTTDGKDSFFDLIEISGRLEVDLTDYVMSTSDDFEVADNSQLYPIGTITSNIGNLKLSNLQRDGNEWVPGMFDPENEASPYHKYIDANAEVRASYNYYDADGDLIGSVPQYVMYTGEWSVNNDNEVEIELADYSKFFNNINARAALWENLTVPQIIWRLLDSVGFVNYAIDQDVEAVTEHTIPIFYTDGESTLFEVLNDLAQATQTGIYFDGTGTLRVRTREFMFSPDATPNLTLSSEDNGSTLAQIIELNDQSSFEPNSFKVTYQKTDWSPENNGMPTMQKVWVPENSTVTLRAAPLTRTIEQSDIWIYVPTKDVVTWPFEGIVNVESEIISYSGKQYVYYTGDNGNVKQTKIIKSLDEHANRDSLTPWQYQSRNHYTGALQITERAMWNSEQVRHSIDSVDEYQTRNYVGGIHGVNIIGATQLRDQSKMRLRTTNMYHSRNDIFLATRGDTDDTPFYYYGTKMKFGNFGQQPYGGIVFNNSGTKEDGYYVELTPSKYFSAKDYNQSAEVTLWSRVDGTDYQIDKSKAPVAEGVEAEVDVSWKVEGTVHHVKVWFNGKMVIDNTISGAKKNAGNGRFGLYLRDKSTADFEYLYAVAKQDVDIPDDFSFLDKVKKGYVGDLWSREWVFKTVSNSRRVKKKTNDPRHKVNERFMDDFGPYVHEIREFNVKFDPAPVLHSRLYLTNDWSCACLEYNSDAFGAKFTLANTARINAVLDGDDSLSFAGSGDSIPQTLTVLGRALIVDESQDVTAENEDQIRRRGRIESDLSSQWIQSEAIAKELTQWMNTHFSNNNAQINVRIFGNPLIELGDIVHVVYPDKFIDDDYFVLGVNNEFDSGLNTSLTLRKRV
jgi:hypothetical protein